MFGRRKMYKKGLADAMQAYEAFGKKQEAAIAHMREEIRKGQKLEEALNDTIASLGDDIAGLYDYLNAQEKKALYHLSTPLDIKDLDKEEQQYLLAILYQLASDEGDLLTDYQRMFIRSVQRYLEITNPQTEADLSAVGDIDSLEVQKAFLQTVLEFFYLQDGDELTDTQEEFLGCFSVNKRQALLIEERVSRLFNVVKAEGIAEKYGYSPQEPSDIISSNGTSPGKEADVQVRSDYIKANDKIFRSIWDQSLLQSLEIEYCIETSGYYVFEPRMRDYKLSRLYSLNKTSGELVIYNDIYPTIPPLAKIDGISDMILLENIIDPRLSSGSCPRGAVMMNLKDGICQPLAKGMCHYFATGWPYIAYLTSDFDIKVFNTLGDTQINIKPPFGFLAFSHGDTAYYNSLIEGSVLYCVAEKDRYGRGKPIDSLEFLLLGYDLANQGALKVQVPFSIPCEQRFEGLCFYGEVFYVWSWYYYSRNYPERKNFYVWQINPASGKCTLLFSESVDGTNLFEYAEGNLFYPFKTRDDFIGIKMLTLSTGESTVLVPDDIPDTRPASFYCMNGWVYFKDKARCTYRIDPQKPGQIESLG